MDTGTDVDTDIDVSSGGVPAPVPAPACGELTTVLTVYAGILEPSPRPGLKCDEEPVEDRQEGVAAHDLAAVLDHAAGCDDADCHTQGCERVRRLVSHARSHPGVVGVRTASRCCMCRLYFRLVREHTRTCDGACVVPFCRITRRCIASVKATIGVGVGVDTCVICMTAPKCVVTLPCRHLVLCNECATKIRDETRVCPICRVDIVSTIHVYT